MSLYRAMAHIDGTIELPDGSVFVNASVPGYNPHRNVLLRVPDEVLQAIECSPGPREHDDTVVYLKFRTDYAEPLRIEGPWTVSRVYFRNMTPSDWVEGDLGVEILSEEEFA